MKQRKPIFMIHKHQATHLHYDLRLEIEGTLKSWALREISLNPSKPMLAIQVNDHPFWYRHFEGVIPEGSYGAGPVMVWEKGLYTGFTQNSAGKKISLAQGLKQGFLLLTLEGKKLHGDFLLIRISKKQRWLFIKLDDKYAQVGGRKPSSWNYSVKTGRTLEQIFEGKKLIKKKSSKKVSR